MNCHLVPAGLTTILLLLSAMNTSAASCSTQGRLRHLGNLADQSASVWVSATGAGEFALEAQSTRVDTWSRQRLALRISMSPVVSSGQGLPHTLIDTTDGCELDRANQSGPITFPPDFHLPTLRPPIVRPPIEVLPPVGITPGLPIGVTPPIGTLPPTGITPEVPIGVTPPIGTLPPTGITPEVPISVTPPIGTLPPTGITPEVPINVTPPIGTLPPTGITPEVPISVTPPIGTLPPTGITPEVPIGVTPPIGTLPPTGITPEVPIGVTPPIGTLRPESEVSINGTGNEVSYNVPVQCADGTSKQRLEDCSDPGFARNVSISEGRRFAEEPDWNLWIDGQRARNEDRRYGLDIDGDASFVTLGLDRRIDVRSIVGIFVTKQEDTVVGFGDSFRLQTDSQGMGAYYARRSGKHWAINASLAYSNTDADTQIDILGGHYSTETTTGSLTATGQYLHGAWYLRPKATISYSHIDTDGYNLQGSFLARQIELKIGPQSTSSGVMEGIVETGSYFTPFDATEMEAFLAFGPRFEYARPADGQLLARDLTTFTPSAWSGNISAGLRALLGRTVFVELSGRYTSLGQQGLRAWDTRLYVSVAF